MRRLALVLAVLGICAVAGACDGTRGVTEPAGRVQNIGTMGSGHRDDTTTTQDNGGTMGSGHRDGTEGNSTATTQDNGGTIGSGHRSGTGVDSIAVTVQNGGTIGSGH
jgi:hypothetical protein